MADAQLALFPQEVRERPLCGCCTPGWHAYTKAQRAFDKAELRAVRGHRAVKPIRDARQALVHAALAGSA